MTRIRRKKLRITFAYEHMGVVMGLLKRWGLEPAQTDFQMTCALDVDVRLSESEGFHLAMEQTRVAKVQALS